MPENSQNTRKEESDAEVPTPSAETIATDPIDCFLTILFLFSFGILLLVWDVVQRVTFYLFGEQRLHPVSGMLNRLILVLLRVATGARFSYESRAELDPDLPYLVISNHQSMFDISMLHSFFLRRDPRFVAKRELSRYIPGISFNLRAGAHAIIDRSNAGQALKEIVKLARRMEKQKFLTVLFPEGTRARTGILKPFKPSGFVAALRNAPSAKIALVAIDGSWRLNAGKGRIIPRGTRTRLSFFATLDPKNFASHDAIVEESHRLIAQELARLRA